MISAGIERYSRDVAGPCIDCAGDNLFLYIIYSEKAKRLATLLFLLIDNTFNHFFFVVSFDKMSLKLIIIIIDKKKTLTKATSLELRIIVNNRVS